MENKVGRIITGAIVLLFAVWMNYLFMPAWNVHSSGMWWFLFLMAVFAAIAYGIVETYSDDGMILTVIMAIIAVILIIIIIIGGCTSAKMFNASHYQQLIDIEEATEDFSEVIPSVDGEVTIPIVDIDTARKLGDRTIGTIQNATWYEVSDEYNLIKYQGKYYRVSELQYGGLFKYNKAKNAGIPGYVLVDVETQEATYMEFKKPIKYSPSAHFAYDLTRHLHKQYPSYMFGKSFFELDEEGNPYYITPVDTTTIGMFGGKTEGKFILTDAVTGENTIYSTEELPEWIEHAYSVSYLMERIDYHQIFVNGYWNSVTSQTGVNKTTYQYINGGYNTVITTDGDVVFYTGVTPASTAETNIGFILVSPRTGKVKYYTCAGAEESSAQVAAEGLVQNLQYKATFPTILNVDGEETYFMLMKDAAGLVQRYALCNVKNYTKVVQAETLEEALKLYREKLGMVEIEAIDTQELFTNEGKISALYQAEVNGFTHYYFTIEGSDDFYISSIENNSKQVMLGVGTKVEITYVASSEEGVYIVKEIKF